MSQYKKVLITIPDNLLFEIDSLAVKENINRSELFRNVMKMYLKERRKNELRDKLIQGYQEMANLNLELAQVCVEVDNKCQMCYEEKLAECE